MRRLLCDNIIVGTQPGSDYGTAIIIAIANEEALMAEIKVCGGCGIPRRVGKEQRWRDNGVIAHAKDPGIRMIFYESENLDNLFHGIEEIIGLPIEHIVIESKRRDVKEYTERTVPRPARLLVRRIGFGVVARQLSNLGLIYGFGAVRMGESRRRFDDDDYQVMYIKKPHSIAFFTGEVLGAWEAIDGRESCAAYERVGEDEFKVTCRIGKHPLELSGRLERRRYSHKPGDIGFARCAVCGVPRKVAEYRWDLKEGTITHPETGRRMTIISPSGLDAIFSDLESELGEEIPAAVIEAQRRFARRIMAEADWREEGLEGFREMLALRGLGYLEEMNTDGEGIRVVIRNPCLPLLMVGTVQGMFELASGREASSYDWGVTQGGDLEITVRTD